MKLRFLIYSIFLSASLTAQTQLGQDITLSPELGQPLAVSSDGNIIATAGTTAKVFQIIDNQWVQIGEDIDTNSRSVDLSSDGSIIAVGKPVNSLNGAFSGQACIFQFNNNQWEQLGQNINGDDSYDYLGGRIALSSNGNIVAIATSNYSLVRIYQFSNNQWVQLGNDIVGGYSIALSADGQIIAIGYPSAESGLVRVFQLSNNQWIQMGNSIVGEAEGDNSGTDIAISSDGTIIAIGASYNDGEDSYICGHVRVFTFENNQWTQIGQDIDGEAELNFSGGAVSLSSNGNMLAIGAIYNDGGANSSGHVRVFQNINNQWIQFGDDIDGQAEDDRSGFVVDLSADGNKVAIGSRNNNGSSIGFAQIFQFGKPNLTSNDLCFTLDHNPIESQYILEGDFTNCNIFILDQNENVVQFLLNINDKITIDLDDLPAGQHFIRVEHQQHDELFVQKIIKL